MADRLRTARLEAAALGIDTDSAPSSVERGKGAMLQNYLTGEQGRTRQRGSITATGLTHDAAPARKRIVSATPGFDRVLIGRRAADATATIEPHVAPYVQAASISQLAIAAGGSTDLKLVNFKAGTVAPVNPGDRSFVPGAPSTRYGKYVYTIGYDTNDDTNATCVDNGRGGLERLRALLMWDGTGSSAPITFGYSPYGAQDLRIHYNKLLVLGGRSPSTGGLNIRHNRIWHTQELGANDYDFGISPNQAWTAGPSYPPLYTGYLAWQDPANLPNELFIDLPGDESDFGVAFGSAGRHLAIFKRNSIVLLTGYGVDTWAIRTFADGIGCLDPRSVVDANDGCFFLSAHGYYFYDGVQLIDASKGVHRALLTAGLKNVGDNGLRGGFAISERLDNDYIMLTIGCSAFLAAAAESANSKPVIDFCGLYHIPSNSWATFQSPLFVGSAYFNGVAATDAAPNWLGGTQGYVFAADATTAYVINNLTTPENVAEASRGKEATLNIETVWHSRAVELSSPFAKSALHRVIIDYEWVVDGQGADADSPAGPTVDVLDGQGNALITAFTLPSQADTAVELNRKRYVKDCFAETSELQIRITYASTARALVKSAIHDVWIEYAPAQERH